MRYTRTGEWSALLSAQHDAIAHRYGDIRLDPFARGLRMPGQAGEGAERAVLAFAKAVDGQLIYELADTPQGEMTARHSFSWKIPSLPALER